MKHIDTLVYVENSDQVDGLENLLKNKKQDDFIILAISPSAQSRLLELKNTIHKKVLPSSINKIIFT